MYPWPLPRKGQPLTRYYLDVVWFMQARTQTEGIRNFIFLHWLANKSTRLICNMSTHLYLELDGNNIWSLRCTLLWFYVKRTHILASPIYCPAVANPAPFANGHTDCDHLYRQLVISLKYPQQIKNDSQHVQGRIFKQLENTQSERTARRQKANNFKQGYLEGQLGCGLLLMYCHQITAVGRGPVAWEIRARVSVSERERLVVKGEAFWLKPFDGADVQCSPVPVYPAVSLYRATSTSPNIY